jgi:hypothetical protein
MEAGQAQYPQQIEMSKKRRNGIEMSALFKE